MSVSFIPVSEKPTDIAWASKQAKSMSSMFEAFPTAKYKFEIPRYSGQEKLEVK